METKGAENLTFYIDGKRYAVSDFFYQSKDGKEGVAVFSTDGVNAPKCIWKKIASKYMLATDSASIISRIKPSSSTGNLKVNHAEITGNAAKDSSAGYFYILDGWGRLLYKGTQSITWHASTLIDGAIVYDYDWPEGESFTFNANTEYYVLFWPNMWDPTCFYYDTEITWGKYKNITGTAKLDTQVITDATTNPTDRDFVGISSFDDWCKYASADNYNTNYYYFTDDPANIIPVTYWFGNNLPKKNQVFSFKNSMNYLGKLDTAPSDPAAGDFYYNTTESQYRVWTGTEWLYTWNYYGWLGTTYAYLTLALTTLMQDKYFMLDLSYKSTT